MYFSLMTPRADRKFSRESLIRIDQIRLDWISLIKVLPPKLLPWLLKD